jgi:hypothetical protein
MRELKAVWESDPVGQAWAEQMRQTLKKARRSVDAAIEEGAACLSPVTIEGLRELYLNTAEQGVTANTPGTAGRSHDAYKMAKDAGTRRSSLVLHPRLRHRVDEQPRRACHQNAKLQAKIAGVGAACAD